MTPTTRVDLSLSLSPPLSMKASSSRHWPRWQWRSQLVVCVTSHVYSLINEPGLHCWVFTSVIFETQSVLFMVFMGGPLFNTGPHITDLKMSVKTWDKTLATFLWTLRVRCWTCLERFLLLSGNSSSTLEYQEMRIQQPSGFMTKDQYNLYYISIW